MNCVSTANFNKLYMIKKKAIRIVTNSKYNAHTLPLFLQNNIMPLEKIIKAEKLKFMHSIYYGYAPKSFENIWQKNETRDSSIE